MDSSFGQLQCYIIVKWSGKKPNQIDNHVFDENQTDFCVGQMITALYVYQLLQLASSNLIPTNPNFNMSHWRIKKTTSYYPDAQEHTPHYSTQLGNQHVKTSDRKLPDVCRQHFFVF